VAHNGLRSERIYKYSQEQGRETFSGRLGGFVFIVKHKNEPKSLPPDDFWAQNVPKMLLRPGLRLEPRWGSSQRSPALARFRWSLRFAARKGGKRDRKGGRQGEREGRVKIGRRRKVEGRR